MMQKKIKKRVKMIGLGFLIGILLIIIQKSLNLPNDLFMKSYIIIAPIIIILALVINITWQIRFQKKIKNLLIILEEENDPDRFIYENNVLLKRVKHPYNIAIISINISAGYSAKKDYIKAKEVLLGIPFKGLKGANKVVYYINLAYYDFKLGEYEEAINVMDEHKNEFKLFEKNPILGKHIKLNTVFYLQAKSENEKAEILLEELKKEITDKRFMRELEEL